MIHGSAAHEPPRGQVPPIQATAYRLRPRPARQPPTQRKTPTRPDRTAAPPTHPHLVSFVSGHGVKTAVVSAHLPARQHRLFLPLHLLGGLTSHSAPRTYARRHHSPSRSRGEGFVLQNFLYVSPPTPRRAALKSGPRTGHAPRHPHAAAATDSQSRENLQQRSRSRARTHPPG